MKSLNYRLYLFCRKCAKTLANTVTGQREPSLSMRLSRRTNRLHALLPFVVMLAIALVLVFHPMVIRKARKRSWKDDVAQFRLDWCRMQNHRTDWYGILIPCQGKLAWPSRESKINRTAARQSYISSWQLKPVG